jgi:hypothetical protein
LYKNRIKSSIDEIKQKRDLLYPEEIKARKEVQQSSAHISYTEENIKKLEDQIVQEEKLRKMKVDEINNFKQQVDSRWNMHFKSSALEASNKGFNLSRIDSRIT